MASTFCLTSVGKKPISPHDHLCWQTRTWRSRGEGRPHRSVTRKCVEHSSAIRQGKWKMVRLAERLDRDDPPPAWQLYDLTTDIGEQKDLSATHPRNRQRTRQAFQRMARGHAPHG